MSSQTNMNFLSPLNFVFILKRAPTVTFYIQECSIPAINLNTSDSSNPFVKTPYAGDHLDFEPLDVTFKVDENLKNYLEIFRWMTGLGFPERFSQYKKLQDQQQYTGEGVFSDITLTTLSSCRDSKFDVTFIDAIPIFLSSVKFNTTDQNLNYVTASARFKYSYFKIDAVGEYECLSD